MRIRLLCAATALAFGAALAGCHTSAATSDSSVRLAPDERVVLTEIRFDYAEWTEQDAAFLENARASEEEWRGYLREGFEEAAAERGLGAGTGAEVALTIQVVDLDPGSGAGRTLLSSSSSRGIARVIATCAGRGSLVAGAAVESSSLAGMGATLRKLGGEVANGIADSPLLPLGSAGGGSE